MSRQRSNRSEFDFFFPLDVRWGDMDALGHVNNCEYFRYAESARIAYFDEIFGADPFRHGTGPILANIGCNYHEQVKYPAKLDCAVAIRSVGKSSLVMDCPVFRQGEATAVADLQAVLVWFDYRAQASIAVPDVLRERVKQSD